MKVSKQITTVEVIEIEIETPFYCMEGDYYYAIYGEDTILRTWVFNGDSATITTNTTFPKRYVEITEEQFNTAFDKALAIITKSKANSYQNNAPATVTNDAD